MLYTKSQNNYFATPKDDAKDRIQLVIGDDKQVAFYPQKKIKRWDNEVNVSIRLVHNEKAPTFRKDPDKVVWTGEKVEAHFYDIDPNEEHPEGASEFEIFLKEKPATNVVSFTVVDKGVEYYYQPELTQEEKDNGSFQPENIIGSYAIYTKEQKHNFVGGKEYKCGKVGHIYRPQIEDAKGIKVWGELRINKGLLTVTIPQEFLDNAEYPVRHAAGLTFGYSTIGADNNNIPINSILGSKFTLSENGTVTQITGYLRAGSGTSNIKALIVRASDLTIITNGISNPVTATTTYGWTNFVFATNPYLTAGDYYLCYIPQTFFYLRSSSGGNRLLDSSNNYTTPTDPTDGVITGNVKYSVYATYTAEGGGGGSAIKSVNGLAKASVKSINGLSIASVKSWDGLG